MDSFLVTNIFIENSINSYSPFILPTVTFNVAKLTHFRVWSLGEIVLQRKLHESEQKTHKNTVLKEILNNKQQIEIFNLHFQN